MNHALEFAAEDLPWIDRLAAQVDGYIDSVADRVPDPELLRYQLFHWVSFGYVVIPGAIEPELVDAMLDDLDTMLANHRDFPTIIESHQHGHRPIREVDDETISDHRRDCATQPMRIMDFIHNSVAAKQISLHPNITTVFEHVLGDRVVAFQSLNFFQGSQQPIHQDFAYVPGRPRPRLVASWVALEDIHPDSGPLRYIPGSHRLRKFDWAPGPHKIPGTARNELEFQDHILQEAAKAGLQTLTFCPKKGDAFLWHSALAHGGSLVNDPSRTRKTHVTHYAPKTTHDVHVHAVHLPAEFIEYPGGFAMRHPLHPEMDDVLRGKQSEPPLGAR